MTRDTFNPDISFFTCHECDLCYFQLESSEAKKTNLWLLSNEIFLPKLNFCLQIDQRRPKRTRRDTQRDIRLAFPFVERNEWLFHFLSNGF